MVTAYVPEVGDIAVIDFDPQVGQGQAKRRPALVLTDQRYNRATGLAMDGAFQSSTTTRRTLPSALSCVLTPFDSQISRVLYNLSPEVRRFTYKH